MCGPRLRKGYSYLILFMCLALSPGAYSASIQLQPTAVYAGTGSSISLDVVVAGLGNGAPDSLGAFDISVGFDTSALSFTGYDLGAFLGDVSQLEAIDASSGPGGSSVNVAEVSLLSAATLDASQPGTFTVASLNFDVTNLGAGVITQLSILPGAILGDALGFAIVPVGLGSASVEGIVPLPGTFFLLMASLFGWLTLTGHQQRRVK